MIKKYNSFSIRLSFYIITITGALFFLSFALYFNFTKKIIKAEAIQKSEAQLENVIDKINDILASVENRVETSVCFIEENIHNPKVLKRILNNMLKLDSSICGASIALEPKVYKNLQYYMLYANSDGNNITIDVLDGEKYNYHTMDWYRIPKLLKHGYWSEPYYDAGAGNVIMTTYTQLLFDNHNKMLGVVTADVSLAWFSETILNYKPYDSSYTFMLCKNAYYLTHRDKDKILNKTIFMTADEMGNSDIDSVGKDMLGLKKGYRLTENNGVRVFAFYAPVSHIGWSVCTVSTYEDVMADFNKISIIVWRIAICGFILIFIFSILIIRKLANPLKIFANSAAIIAKGDFNVVLPELKFKDEMYALREAFIDMQTSLRNYMAELKETTITRERIDSELFIAQQIQMGMLPKIGSAFNNYPNIDLAAMLKPAKEVGGDLYDFLIKDDKLFFTIGDVSGKGIPASLLMAVTSCLFRSLSSYMDDASKILENINKAISSNNDANMFITLFVGILDLKTGKLEFSNAGHNPPIIINNNEVGILSVKPNIAVGILHDKCFIKEELQLNGGDLLFLYTDGLTEAENKTLELYSEDRLISNLKAINNYGDPKYVIEKLEASTIEFVAGNQQSDDLTMLAIQYKGGSDNHNNFKNEITIKNEIEEISKLVEFVEQIGKFHNLEPTLVMNLNLALEEAISNIILYAYPNKIDGDILITITKLDNSLIFTISDNGLEFDPTLIPDADICLSAKERKVGGLGIFLIRKIMDEFKYERIEGKNILTLKRLIK